MRRKPPTSAQRWYYSHFFLGSVVIGGIFAAFMAVTGAVFGGEDLAEILWSIPFWMLFGPAMQLMNRWQIRRLDARDAV